MKKTKWTLNRGDNVKIMRKMNAAEQAQRLRLVKKQREKESGNIVTGKQIGRASCRERV